MYFVLYYRVHAEVVTNIYKVKCINNKLQKVFLSQKNKASDIVIRNKMDKLETSSQIFSSVGNHDTAKWQFCKTTQRPSVVA